MKLRAYAPQALELWKTSKNKPNRSGYFEVISNNLVPLKSSALGWWLSQIRSIVRLKSVVRARPLMRTILYIS